MTYDQETGLGYDYPSPLPASIVGRNTVKAFQRGFDRAVLRPQKIREQGIIGWNPYHLRSLQAAFELGWSVAIDQIRAGKGVSHGG